jgi:aryl-alcohol dehydrogenase-like predicted oxidoreductase
VQEVARDYAGFCAARGLDPVSTAVAWVAAHPGVTCPIIGARSVEQLMPSLRAMDVPMTPDLRTEIGALSRAPALATDRSEEAK